MSISANFPALKTSLLLDFANTQQLDPRVTFSRSTTAPYYDGKTSVLAEQNLLLQSQVLTNATYWVTVNSTITGNSTTAPDGTTTANTVTDNATNGGHRVYQGGGNLSTATALTASAYFLQGTGTFGQLGLYDGSAYRTVTANLNTGVITETFGTATSTITSVGGGWYRLTISFTGGSSNATISIGLSNTGTPSGLASYVGTGSTIYAWGAQLEQRSAVTAYNATTTSAISNYIPQLLTAPINSPRFDFNPTTGESLGLLIEQSSTNLFTYSEQFDNATWNKINSTITVNSNISPDGTLNADTFIPTLTGGLIFQTLTKTASAITYTITLYAKSAGLTSLRMYLYGASNANRGEATFDLNAGNFSTVQSVGTFTNTSANITAVGNSWYRCSITTTSNTDTAINLAIRFDGTVNSFSGIYIWGAHLEALAFPTSYIPTTSAQVTRASDNASMTGTNFSSWYNIAQGTIYSEAKCFGISSASLIGQLYASATNYIDVGRYQSTLKSVIISNGSTVATLDTGLAINSFNKLSVSYANNSYNASGNGGTVQTSSSGLVPTGINTLNIGNYQGNNLFLNGWIKKLSYYPLAFTGSQNQALTGS
jgi:hypothetical protein